MTDTMIEEAAAVCADEYRWKVYSNLTLAVKDSFKEGVKWASDHQWIKVTDELPEADSVVLTMDKYGTIRVGCLLNGIKWVDELSEEPIYPVYWMVIPRVNVK